MKFIIALISLVLASSAFANDQQALSKLIANNYQMMIDELAPGNYSSVVRVTYIFQTGEGNSGTIAVLMIPEIAVIVPSKMDDCLESNGSLACKVATAAFEWSDTTRPVNGQFQINLQLGGKVKEIHFPIK